MKLANIAAIVLAAQTAWAGPHWERLSGDDSAVSRVQTVVVRDQAAWKALWAEHAAGRPDAQAAPEVDFSKSIVVAAFLGEKPAAGYAVELDLKPAEPGAMIATVRAKKSSKGFSAAVVTRPYEFRTAPASVVTVRFDGHVMGGRGAAAAATALSLGDAQANTAGERVARMTNPFAQAKSDTVLAAAGLGLRDAVSGGGQAFAGQDGGKPLPPPPGQKPRNGNGQQGKPLPPPPGQDGGKPLPPPPGQERGKPLPPPPGQDGGKPLPPPPQYKPRPGRPPARRPDSIEYDDNRVGTVGYWRMERDFLGQPVLDYGRWRQTEGTLTISRGGSETGLTQGKGYTGTVTSSQYRSTYALHWRWVGYDCDPYDADNCARWESQYRWFYYGQLDGPSSTIAVEVDFADDQALLPWEKDVVTISYGGGPISVGQGSAAFQYAVRGPVVDQQRGTAVITLTPVARNLRAPERNPVSARLVANGRGGLALQVSDLRAKYYAGETLELVVTVKKDSGHWYSSDKIVFQTRRDSALRIPIPANATGTHTFDVPIQSGAGRYKLLDWEFRRAGSRISSGQWIGKDGHGYIDAR